MIEINPEVRESIEIEVKVTLLGRREEEQILLKALKVTRNIPSLKGLAMDVNLISYVGM